MEFQDETIEPMGMCGNCINFETDGDYGQIKCCNSDDERIEENESYGDTVQCPAWKPSATLVYCDKHKRWHWSTWELSCKDCMSEWAIEQVPKKE